MASPIKSVRLTGISARGVILGVFFLALLVGLFFIPEFIDFQRSHFSGGGKRPAATAPAVNEKRMGDLEVAQVSPLQRLSALIEAGYVDEMKAHRFNHGNKTVPGKTNRPEGPDSWANLKSPTSRQALKAACVESLNIVKNLPPDKLATRFALFNFINALSLLREGEKSMAPEEAVRYIEFLRDNVVRMMVQENVDLATYNNFVGLSLGPGVDTNRAGRLAVQLRPFNPRLTLTKINVRKPGGRMRGWDEAGPVYVQMKGYVMGNDVRSIAVYYNGNFISTLKPSKPNSFGQRRFVSKRWNGRGLYAFRVFDKAGQIWEKSYSFYPRAKQFPWRSGSFDIPPADFGDTRLDSFFTFRSGRLLSLGGDEDGFSRF